MKQLNSGLININKNVLSLYNLAVRRLYEIEPQQTIIPHWAVRKKLGCCFSLKKIQIGFLLDEMEGMGLIVNHNKHGVRLLVQPLLENREENV